MAQLETKHRTPLDLRRDRGTANLPSHGSKKRNSLLAAFVAGGQEEKGLGKLL